MDGVEDGTGLKKDASPSEPGPASSRKRRKLHHEWSSPAPDLLTNYPKYLHDFFTYPGGDPTGDKPAVICDNGKGLVEKISYKELDNAANSVKEPLERDPFVNSGFIGVRCDLGTLYPAIILGILRSGKGFFNLDKENWAEAAAAGARDLNLKYFISDPAWRPQQQHHRSFTLRKVKGGEADEDDNLENGPDFRFSMYEICLKSPVTPPQIDTSFRTAPSRTRFAYAIQTSGTTGSKKTVLVPHECICPNIHDFIHVRWNLTSQDVIFGCAPPTFDPHIVELFTILAVGGTILYTTSGVKQSSQLLTSILINHHVTILQVTPSLFRRTYLSFSNWKEQLSLRIIAFGGEKCPDKTELRGMRDAICSSPQLTFQNIYGVTEVSCWASVCDIDLSTDDPITIGAGILDTEISLDEPTGEIVLASSRRYCNIIDPEQNVIDLVQENSMSVSDSPRFKYFTGDMGRVVEEGIIFEGRMDRVVKRNGMKVPLFKIEEMTLETGLVSYAECILHKSKIVLLVQLKPEFRKVEKSPQNYSRNSLLPSLSKSLDIPLFMYPDITISLNVIPLNSNGKLDCNSVINSLMKVNKEKGNNCENLPFEISREQVVKTLDPIWRSCTWPGIRATELLLKENFIEVGGDSISAARFIESVCLSLKLFGTDNQEVYEQKLMENLIQGSFDSVVELICRVISQKKCLSMNCSSFTNDLNELQEKLLPFHTPSLIRDDFENEMSEESMYDQDDDDYSVFNQVDPTEANPISLSEIKIMTPIQLVTMYDFTLGLCVDASPTIVRVTGNITGDKVIIGCHGGILLCVDLSVLRNNSKSSNLAIAWKRRMPGRLEASVVISNESSLYGYVGCHDCNFYKFSVATGEIVCYFSCGAPIRSKGAVSDEHELVIVVDSGNGIYCLNYHDLNLIWEQKSYKLLATTIPLVWKNMCYLSALENRLITLDLRSGKEVWNSSNGRCYSSPTFVHVKGESKVKKKCLVLTASLTSSNTEILEARNSTTGKLEWNYMSPSETPYPTVSQPLYNNCCDSITWVSLSDFRLKSFNPANGKFHFDLGCGFTKNNEVSRYCLISGSNKDGMSECTLFYKILGMYNFMFVNLHDNHHQLSLSKPWFLIKDFDTFSVPVSWDQFILLGGRDNKLHVIKCKPVNKE